MNGKPSLLGKGSGTYTPTADTKRIHVQLRVCDLRAAPASENIIGKCTYYYRPLQDEYVSKTGMATWQAVKAWADDWNPWSDLKVAKQLLDHRSALIKADSSSPDWSRHANFMMRHIGCGHQPPSYYVSYGYYYCSRYGKLLNSKLSAKGQDWLREARMLLQRNMESGLRQNMRGDLISIPCKRYPNRSFQMTVPKFQLEITNGIFKTFAFNTHVPSYLDGGLADLPFSDLVQIGAEPNVEEWLDKETWKQAINSGEEVGKQKTYDAAVATSHAAQAIGRAATHAAEATGRAANQALQWLMQHL